MKMDNENRVTHINDLPFEPTNTYLVALPRNLLAGFCEIEPLVHVCVCEREREREREERGGRERRERRERERVYI